MPFEKIKVGPRKKIAFVCSGGAVKAAAFHMGVCLAMQEKGFRFLGGLKGSGALPKTPKRQSLDIDTYVGSSAGSFISSYLASGYSVEQIFNAYLKSERGALRPIKYSTLLSVRSSKHEEEIKAGLSLAKRLRSFTDGALDLLYRRKSPYASGIFSTSGIESYLRNHVLPSNNFSDYAADMFIVTTQLNHSKRVVFNKYAWPSPKDDATCIYDNTVSISDSVAASTALPPLFAPYGIRNHKNKVIYYFDGEIRETLSVNVAEDAGADLIISSYSHQPYHYSREIGSLTKFGIPAIGIQAIYLLIERKIQSAIYSRNQKRAALAAVYEYCVDAQIDTTQRKKICEILERELGVRPDNHYIYIHPRPTDHEMFFGDHFNLGPAFMEKIVRIGFMSAIEALRKYEFS
jgi:predicted acylesterase/phospholipase RssA